MSQDKHSRPGLRWIILGCLATVILAGVVCTGVLRWLATPRVPFAEVDALIRTSLPIGTPRQVVENWLVDRSMDVQPHTEEDGHLVIQSWVPDSGPRGDWLGCKDIRIRFYFGKDERLVRITVQEEDRF
jgi:hypothetical protein